MVFDREAVIAPQRARRVGIIKTSTSERGLLSKGKKCSMEGGRPSEGWAGKDIYSFCFINFHGEITSDVFLWSFGTLTSLAPFTTNFFFRVHFFSSPQISFLFICVNGCVLKKHESEAKALGPPGPALGLSFSMRHEVQRLLQPS